VERNGRHGINIVTGSKHVSVINNQIDYNGFEDEGCGVCFGNNFGFDTRGGFIYQNYIKRSQRAGVCIWDSKEIVIMNNTIDVAPRCFDTHEVTNEHNLMFNLNENICVNAEVTPYNTLLVMDPKLYAVRRKRRKFGGKRRKISGKRGKIGE